MGALGHRGWGREGEASDPDPPTSHPHGRRGAPEASAPRARAALTCFPGVWVGGPGRAGCVPALARCPRPVPVARTSLRVWLLLALAPLPRVDLEVAWRLVRRAVAWRASPLRSLSCEERSRGSRGFPGFSCPRGRTCQGLGLDGAQLQERCARGHRHGRAPPPQEAQSTLRFT